MPFIFGFLAAAIALVLQLVVWLFFPPLFEVRLPITATILFSLFLLALTEESLRYAFGQRYQQRFGSPSLLFIGMFWAGFVSLEVALSLWQESLHVQLILPLILHGVLTFLLFFGLRRKELSYGALLLGLTGLHLLGNILFLMLV